MEAKPYQCPRCAADPQPATFGSPRNCAFTADGQFAPDNWNCATVSALLDLAGKRLVEVEGDDESMQIVPAVANWMEEGTGGWLVFTRYKHRGRTSSAVFAGDFWPPQHLTLELADRVIAALPHAIGR